MDGFQFEYDPGLCRHCHKRYIDRSSGNPNEFLCRECRAELTKLRIPKWLLLCMAVVITAAIVMSVYLGKIVMNNSTGIAALSEGEKILAEVDSLIAEHKNYSAMDVLYNYLEANPNNTGVAIRGMQKAMEIGQYDYAASIYNTYLSTKGFTDAEIKELNKIATELNRYYDTFDKVGEALSEYVSEVGTDMSDESKEALREKCYNSVLKLKDDKACENNVIYYCVGTYLAGNVDESERYLKMAYNYAPLTEEIAGRLAVNERRKGFMSAAWEWVDKGEKVNAEGIEVRRAKATILLAEGKYEEALSVMEELYAFSPDGSYVRDTYCIALYATGNIDKMKTIMSEAKETGDEFDEEFHKVISNRMSIYDYYVEGDE